MSLRHILTHDFMLLGRGVLPAEQKKHPWGYEPPPQNSDRLVGQQQILLFSFQKIDTYEYVKRLMRVTYR